MRKKVCGVSQSGSPGYAYQARPPVPPAGPSSAGSSRKHDELVSCSKCNATFQYARHLERHMRGHTRNDCKQCGEMFTTRKTLVAHIRIKHKKRVFENSFTCKFCERIFSRISSLYKHLRVHAAPGRLVCTSCGEFFDTTEDLEKHAKQHEKSKITCLLCHQTFIRHQQYALHMQCHDKYKCGTCQRGFPAWRSLVQHGEQEGHVLDTRIYQFKCSVCTKTFLSQATLQEHKKMHSTKKKYDCQLCNKVFSTEKSHSLHLTTERHMNLASESARMDQGYVCEICGKKFQRQQSLNTHRIRIHTNRTPYYCDYCSHSTLFKPNLLRHVRLHLNDKRFVCEHCGAAFFVRSALRDHCLYRHSNAREHKCDQCTKTFKRASELTRHKKTHSDVRPHECNLCDKAFKRYSHLSRHKEKFHNEIKNSRLVLRIKDTKQSTALPHKNSVKTKQPQVMDNPQIMILQDKPFADIDAPKDLSTLSLDSSQYFVTLPTQTYQIAGSNIICIPQAMSSSQESLQDYELAKSLSMRDAADHLEVLKHRGYSSGPGEMGSHMLLSSHEAAIRNVLGEDVRLSDSMMEDVDPRQASPGRDSPLCMSDLVRLHDSSLSYFRSHDVLQRDQLGSPMPGELQPEHLAALHADCVSQNSDQFLLH